MKIPKIIWVLWIDFRNDDDRDLDSLDISIQQYITNIRTTQSSFTINHILSKVALETYIDKTDKKMWAIINDPIIGAAHKSDVIRYYLLNKYGGIWIDTTTILFYDLTDFIGDFELILPYMSINKAIELFFDVYDPPVIYDVSQQPKPVNVDITTTMAINYTCKYVPENYFIASIPSHNIVRNILESLLTFWDTKPTNSDELKQKLVDEMFKLVYGEDNLFTDSTYDYTKSSSNFINIWDKASYLFNYAQLYKQLCECSVSHDYLTKQYDFKTTPQGKKDAYILKVCKDDNYSNNFCYDILCDNNKIKLFSAAYLRLFRWTIPELNTDPVINSFLDTYQKKEDFINKMKSNNIVFIKMSSYTRNSPIVAKIFERITQTTGGKYKSYKYNKKNNSSKYKKISRKFKNKKLNKSRRFKKYK